MPRYELRNTTGSALTYIEGDWPLNLMLSQAVGSYRARAMSEEQATDIVVPTLTASIIQTSLTVGQTATLTTNAPAGATYQWRLNGTNISGATSASYVTAAAGTLTCRVALPGDPQPPVITAGVTVTAPAAWTLDEDFSGLALDAALVARAEWASIITNGAGQIQGTGTGTIKTPRTSGTSNFPGETARYEVDIGANQEVEIDLVSQGAGTSFTRVGAALRANSANANCYQATLSPTEGFRVEKGTGWTGTPVAAPIAWTPPALPATANFRAITSGSTCVIECRVNGTLVGSMTDTSPLTGVRVGLSALTGGGVGTGGPLTVTAIRARALV